MTSALMIIHVIFIVLVSAIYLYSISLVVKQ